MDLTTSYLGLTLRTPLVPSASPLSEDLDNIRRMEDAGASAVVLHSLFEEQITADALEHFRATQEPAESFAEALSYFPEPSTFRVGPQGYLDHIREAREAVDIPVIASLNGCTPGGWVEYAREIEQAGASALELNLYHVPADPKRSGSDIEEDLLEVVRQVRSELKIPLAVKLSPFLSSPAHMAAQLDSAGVDGLVLFNRFYQPDLDLDKLEVRTRVVLSGPQAMRLPLRWIAILHGRVGMNLAASGGIHEATDVLKVMMAGASVAQLCSVLLKRGIQHLHSLERDLRHWLEDNEYHSIEQLRGSLSQRACPDPTAFERAQYVRTLQSYTVFRKR